MKHTPMGYCKHWCLGKKQFKLAVAVAALDTPATAVWGHFKVDHPELVQWFQSMEKVK